MERVTLMDHRFTIMLRTQPCHSDERERLPFRGVQTPIIPRSPNLCHSEKRSDEESQVSKETTHDSNNRFHARSSETMTYETR
jgi:hypothetical protein